MPRALLVPAALGGLALETDPQAAIAIAVLLVVVALAVLLSLRDRWLRGLAA